VVLNMNLNMNLNRGNFDVPVEAPPGRGAPLHIHEYDEIVLLQEGQSRLVIGDVIHEAGPGDILVIKAKTPHGFINTGSGLLKQIDIHVSPRFEQELVAPTEVSRRANLLEPSKS
jgi:mannose-6-phosphate isomerase-like protein (cupin superfamily)